MNCKTSSVSQKKEKISNVYFAPTTPIYESNVKPKKVNIDKYYG